ncbi:procathepsin L [Drosophila eugracilis]|uniref:procathepsin L n=1 Tax=Drosophila eugracilis TaxID=29029 RepID=UPI0007E5E419|nr:procathepsin L [Drosophila eugracilis]XP_017079417.1 procathepsin L [Drosophila eugracilis]
MKLLLVLPLLVAVVSGQRFGGFGGFGGLGNNPVAGAFQNAASNIQGAVSNIASTVPKVPLLSNVQNFGDFLAQSGKTYLSAADQALHEGAFATTKNLVEAGNEAFARGAATFKQAVNAFADLTHAEFLKQLTGLKRSPEAKARAAASLKEVSIPPSPVPDSFDWREHGGVTPVKFQGTCGSCWAFATTGAIEGHTFRKTGSLPNLSEQNLVDCGPVEDFGLNGCDGGFQEAAFCFIDEVQKGVSQAGAYPYIDNKDKCKYDGSQSGAHLEGFAAIPPKDEEQMKKVVATLGPIACSVNGLESLKNYAGGIYNDNECNQGEPNHSILVVGYGSENGQDYWIVKNSWDDTWGEAGYFRLPRGLNYCFIADECSYPVV